MRRKRQHLPDPGICFEALEPRLLLSGTWGTGADSPVAEDQTTADNSFSQDTVVASTATESTATTTDAGSVDLLAEAPALNVFGTAVPDAEAAIPVDSSAAPAETAESTVAADSPSEEDDEQSTRELVLVNDNVTDYEQLIADIQGNVDDRNIEVVILDSDIDGIAQVSEILAGRSNLDAVHIISHGDDGRINLGSTWLNSDSAEQSSGALAAWGDALTADGDILFYGCDVASGLSGQNLLTNIAKITRADIAASTDPTGHESRGGDWDLEFNSGVIESQTVVAEAGQKGWENLLAPNTAPVFADSQGDGIVTSDLIAAAEYGQSIVLQADGKILVAGYSGSLDFALARYNSDGTLDTSFSGDGVVTLDIGGGWGVDVAVQSDGKILVAGYTDGWDFALARFNADGTLDTSFDGDGMLTTDLNSGSDELASSMTLQADGKILVAGYSYNGTDYDFALVRYNADGSLDTTFNGTGIVITDTGGADYAEDVQVQSDGKIILTGHSDDDFAVVRYNSDGSLDTTFNTTGVVTTAVGGSTDIGYSAAIQPDGKILVAGCSENGLNDDFALVRYNDDGSLDTGFGTNGIVTLAIDSSADIAHDVTIQPDGKILVSGSAFIGGSYDFAVVRYNSDGSLDSNFGSSGVVTTAIGSDSDVSYGMLLQPDGKIVMAGYSHNGTDYDFAIVRYNSDGSLDNSFDTPTTLDGTPAFNEGGAAVVLDSDVTVFDEELSAIDNFDGATLTLVRNGGADTEDIFSETGTLGSLTEGGNLVVGATTIGTVTTNSNGTLLLTFNSNATNALVNSAMQQIAYSNSSDNPPATVQIDWTINDGNSGAQGSGGALSCTGSTTVTITAVNDAPVATDDSATLNEGATVTIDLAANDSDIDDGLDLTSISIVSGPSYGSVVVNADGTVTYTHDGSATNSDSFTYTIDDLSGETSNTATVTLTITAVNDAPMFAAGPGDGIVLTDATGWYEYGNTLAVQADGKILVGGSDGDFLVARYNVDGTLDASFGTGGIVEFAGIGSFLPDPLVVSVAVQPDGKILIAGSDYNSQWDIALLRLNEDGSLDTTFNSGAGIVITDLGADEDVYSLALQPDGKILLAGQSSDDFLLLRYNPNGSLDTTFGTGGIVTTAIGTGLDAAYSTTLDADGKILLAGTSDNGTDFDFAVVRYNTDGSLDTGFSGDGIFTTPIGASSDQAYRVIVQPDGNILVGGNALGVYSSITLLRLDSAGNPDASFGSNGIMVADLGLTATGFNIAMQNDGKILATGYAGSGGNEEVLLVRFEANGSLDTSFGSGGIVTTAVSLGNDAGHDVLPLDSGKILVTGYADVTDIVLLRYNADGSLDTSFDTPTNLDGTPTFTEDGAAVVLDSDVTVFDEELSTIDNFDGATLTLVRNGGADTEDIFSATGTLDSLTEGGNLVVGATIVGTVTTNSGGILLLTFNSNATNALVNSAMQQIAYSNTSDAPPDTVQIDWTFDDGNTGDQGTGGNLQCTGSTTVSITAVNDAPVFSNLDDTPTFILGGDPVVLDGDVTVYDAELNAADNYDGATLTLSRNGGADANDVFDATGNLVFTFEGGALELSGVEIGTVTQNSAGTLVLTFNSDATQPAVNEALQSITFENTSGSTGNAQIDWTFDDGNTGDQGTGGNLQATGNITVTITDNQAPLITSNGGGDTASINVYENTSAATTVTATDADGDTPTFSISGGTDAALFDIDTNTGDLTFITAPDYESPGDSDSDNVYEVEVTADDGNGGTDTQAISVTVTDVNEAPTVVAVDLGSIDEDNAITITQADLLTGSSDPDGDSLTALDLSLSTGSGTLTDNGDGTWTFTPDGNWTGSVSFGFKVTDGAASEANTASLTVNQVDDAGTFGGDTSGTGNEDAGDITGTLTFADAADGATTPNFTVTGAATNGSASIDNATGDWTYTPDADFNGADSFTVSVTDDDGNTETQVISITVNANNPPVIGGTDTGTVTEDVDPDSDTLLEVANALTITDPGAGQSSFVAETVTGTYGNLTIDAVGNWSYAADNNQTAIQSLDIGESVTDTLTVTTADGSSHDITVTIDGAEDAAVIAGNFTGAVVKDGVTTVSGPLTISDVDTSDNPVAFIPVTATPGDNGYGSFSFSGGIWTYTLDDTHAAIQAMSSGDTLTDSFTFTAGDGSTRVVMVTINGPALVPGDGPDPTEPGNTGTDPDPDPDPDPVDPDPLPEPELPLVEIPPVVEEVLSPEEPAVTVPGPAKPSIVAPTQEIAGNFFVPKITLPITTAWIPQDKGPSADAAVDYLIQKLPPREAANPSPDASAVHPADAMSLSLDRIRQQFDLSMKVHSQESRMVIGLATGLGISVFAGYVIWAFRGASLIAGALSVLPMWRSFDPLAVILNDDKEKMKAVKEKINAEADKDEDEVKELLDTDRKGSVKSKSQRRNL